MGQMKNVPVHLINVSFHLIFIHTSHHTAFNVPHLETNPTATVYRPSVGALAHTENKLPPHEETQVQYVLDVLRDYVTRRRITMLYPFFKDFDRVR